MTSNTNENKLLYGDCIPLMRLMPSNSVDFCLTDPPYIVGYRSRDGRTIAGDTSSDWLKPAFAEIYRLLKPDSYCVSFYGWNQAHRFMYAWKDAGFTPVGHIVWRKPYPSSVGFLQAHHEMAYLLAKGRPKKPRRPPRDVLNWGTYTGNVLHPTQKPVSALKPLIYAFSPFDGFVLDPFAGSATTAVAALECNRRYIAIEKDDTYYRAAHQRLGELSAITRR